MLSMVKQQKQINQPYTPNLTQDNTIPSQRKKEIVFWNLYALGNIYSISQLFSHANIPSQHTIRDHEWKDLFFINKEYKNNKKREETFISRAEQYIRRDNNVLDRISWLKNQQFQLKIIKFDFWNKIKNLRPKTKEQAQCKKILSFVMMKQRMPVLFISCVFGIIFNIVTGIRGLSFLKRAVIFGSCLTFGQFIFRYKNSDDIFYGLPKLPDEELEGERKQILRECIFFDGRTNDYGNPIEINEDMYLYITKQKTIQEQENLAKALKLKVIRQEDL